MKHLLSLFATLLLAFLLSGCSDCTVFGYGRDLKGKVVRSPTSRYKAGKEGKAGTEKIALTIQAFGTVDAKIQDVAGGPKGVVVECYSTRCSQLEIGDCVWLECAYEHRWTEVDVIKCKHKKEIACEKSDDDKDKDDGES